MKDNSKENSIGAKSEFQSVFPFIKYRLDLVILYSPLSLAPKVNGNRSLHVIDLLYFNCVNSQYRCFLYKVSQNTCDLSLSYRVL